MTAFKAVLWDFGGVLTTSPFEAFNRFEREHGLPENFIRRVNATNPDHNAWARLESSMISLEEFDRAFEEESLAAGHAIPGQRVIELLAGDVRPRMVAALTECKRRYKVACLTNNVRSAEDPARATLTERSERTQSIMQLFDLVLESSKEGIRKPNPRFYQLACDRLGVVPNEAVFLDDLGINLKPARELGMTTIKVVTEDQAIAELERLLGILVPRT